MRFKWYDILFVLGFIALMALAFFGCKEVDGWAPASPCVRP